MPKIEKTLEVGLKGIDVYKTSIESLKKIGGEITDQEIESETPFSGKISVFISSMWGWGGMKLNIELKEKEGATTILFIGGYIAQLATGPLTKKMDMFLKSLSSILKEEFNYELEYTSSAPKFFSFPGFEWTRSDTLLMVAIFGITALLMILSLVSGIADYKLSLLVIPITYYIGRKLLKKK